MRDDLETRTLPLDLEAAGRTEFMTRIYGWMAAALGITGVTAYAFAQSGIIYKWGPNVFNIMMVLMLVEVGMVWALSGMIDRMSVGVASAVFFAYSLINGVTLSLIFLVYTNESIAATFFVTAGTFAAMSLYGAKTKTDLTSIGSFCYMAVFGLIIASIVNWFVASTMLYWFITYAGVLVFVGLTAYDTQKLLAMYSHAAGSTEALSKLVIMGALTLYLDFINLFLYMLRLLGRRRD